MRNYETQPSPVYRDDKGLKVIAAGQWGCSTGTLQAAFGRIFQLTVFAPCMNGPDLVPSIPFSKHAINALNEPDRFTRQTMLSSLVASYSASIDFPGFAFLPELLDMYPDAKVVLNKPSSPEAWASSLRSGVGFFCSPLYLACIFWLPQAYWHCQLQRTCVNVFKRRYGVNDVFSTECLRRHSQWVHVTAAARRKQVLEWEPSHGWEPLCRFLGRDIPQVPIPMADTRVCLEDVKRSLVLKGLAVWIGILLLFAAAAYITTIMYALHR
ncbi:hypothetical protein K431DRAFT_235223 [Polychaeton citri CBS 116435]|uniref:Uncharacterized protein n=1 Tax=Polychaeton citri CBS 116435 TaxID=1314669 RepID=A0A9P4UL25_9PEZI|nr:hypothetical protein K431DRAFT_235223 [Polychaeton citri CBS 116435]